MAKNQKSILKEILKLPRRKLAGVALSHITLLGVTLFGGLPYLIMQSVLGVEVVLLGLATIPFYPKRGIGEHVFGMLTMTFMLAFIYLFVLISYGAVAGDPDLALKTAWRSLEDAGTDDLLLSLFYVTVSLGMSLWQVSGQPDPRQAWENSRLLDGAMTMFAMIFITFITIFLAKPIVLAFNYLGIPMNVNALLITLMVVTRFFFALIATCMRESPIESIDTQPCAD